MVYHETRPDGWPLCPCCGEDELWSPFQWDGNGEKPPMSAWIDAGVRCYRCGYDSNIWASPPPWPMPASAALKLNITLPNSSGTGSSPPPPPPPTPAQPLSRFVLRYGYLVCIECGMTKDYCRGHATDASQAKDGAESMLAQKIAEVRGRGAR